MLRCHFREYFYLLSVIILSLLGTDFSLLSALGKM